MDRLADALASPAGLAAVLAGVAWAPATGFPTWPSLARGRFASTLTTSLGAAVFVFVFVARLTAPPPW